MGWIRVRGWVLGLQRGLVVVDGGAFVGVHWRIRRRRVWPVVGVLVRVGAGRRRLAHHRGVTVVRSGILARRRVGVLGFEAGRGNIPGGRTQVVVAKILLGIEKGVDGRLLRRIVGVHWQRWWRSRGGVQFSSPTPPFQVNLFYTCQASLIFS
jgi:hypothetical protein